MREAIGVDVGGTGIKALRVREDGAVLAESSAPTDRRAEAALAQIDASIAALDGPAVSAIGVGVPGRVDVRDGRMLSGGYVDLSGPPVRDRLPSVAGRAFHLDNDAVLALVGEARAGAAKGLATVAMLTIGTGIGGAAIADGRVLRGAGGAGHFGHFTVELDGAPCVCGRRGCFEAIGSGTALGAAMRAAGLPPDLRAEDLGRRDDAAAHAVLDRWTRGLRAGVGTLVAALDPGTIVLGGSLGPAAAEALARAPEASPWFACSVLPAAFGSRAGAIGAALAALDPPR